MAALQLLAPLKLCDRARGWQENSEPGAKLTDVRPSESMAETQPQLQPALLSLSRRKTGGDDKKKIRRARHLLWGEAQ
jgi:hypothetical protein